MQSALTGAAPRVSPARGALPRYRARPILSPCRTTSQPHTSPPQAALLLRPPPLMRLAFLPRSRFCPYMRPHRRGPAALRCALELALGPLRFAGDLIDLTAGPRSTDARGWGWGKNGRVDAAGNCESMDRVFGSDNPSIVSPLAINAPSS
jgi:hypothetical protein